MLFRHLLEWTMLRANSTTAFLRLKKSEWIEEAATPVNWTIYPKASQFTFDGSNTFQFRLLADKPVFVRLEILSK